MRDHSNRGSDLVEDMIVPFPYSLMDHSRFFKQVCSDFCSGNGVGFPVKVHVDPFPESAGVVVSESFCISESFKH